MKRLHILLLPLVTCFAAVVLTQTPATWSDPAAHKSGFVTANGVRLHYLDWGGSGPPLILIHGLGENPHYFDDLAPAFTDRFRVVAYARRGHGQSDAKGPYDTATLTEDLRALMNGLGIAKAHLAGKDGRHVPIGTTQAKTSDGFVLSNWLGWVPRRRGQHLGVGLSGCTAM